MKFLSLAAGLTFSALAFTALSSTAQADDDFGVDPALVGQPGYVDFGSLSASYGEPHVMVNLDGSLLKLVSAFKHSDPAAEEALRNLESVRIHVYGTDGETKAAETRMGEVRESLQGMDWKQVVRAREAQEKVDIYVKHGVDAIQGVLVMAVDGEEAVFINVLGDINPEQIASIVDQVDVDVDLSL